MNIEITEEELKKNALNRSNYSNAKDINDLVSKLNSMLKK